MSGGIGHLVLSWAAILAVPVAAAAGVVTFLSPCVLPGSWFTPRYAAGMSGWMSRPPSPPGIPPGRDRRRSHTGRRGRDSRRSREGGCSRAGAARPRRRRHRRRNGGEGASHHDGGQPRRARTVAVLPCSCSASRSCSRPRAWRSAGWSVLRTHVAGLTRSWAGHDHPGWLFAGVHRSPSLGGSSGLPCAAGRTGRCRVLGVLFGLSWTPCIVPTPSAWSWASP